MPFGSRNIDIIGEERPQCLLCMKILAADSMKPNKLKMDLHTAHAECFGKTPEFFPWKRN
jgi:hypothetical protein